MYSLQEILDQYVLKKQDLLGECPREIRIKKALKLVDWKVFGNILLLPKEILASIDAENQTEHQKKISLFKSWHEMESKNATNFKLAEKLYEHNRRDLVTYLCELFKSDTMPDTFQVETQAEAESSSMISVILNLLHASYHDIVVSNISVPVKMHAKYVGVGFVRNSLPSTLMLFLDNKY